MLERIRIVLVGTSHPGNIGAVARAMHNMGLADLNLVAPRCETVTADSIARASGADHLLHGATHHACLEDAISDCTLAVGASARSRALPWPMLTPRALGERLPTEWQSPEARIALVFGREDSGLTNAELQTCHAHVHIPTNPDFSSLNLAAAVQVVAYECRLAWLCHSAPGSASAPFLPVEPLGLDNAQAHRQEAHRQEVDGTEVALHADLERYFAHLERTLIEIDFLDPAQPGQLMARLRRLYLRARPEQVELNILRGVLSATEKQRSAPSTNP